MRKNLQSINKEANQVEHPLAKYLLVSALMLGLGCFCAVITFVISIEELSVFFEQNKTLFFLTALVAIFLMPTIVALFPWAFATVWSLDGDKIQFVIPTRGHGRGSQGFVRYFENRGVSTFRTGQCYCTAIRKDGSRFRVPKNMIMKTSSGNVKVSFILLNEKIVFQDI